MATVKTTAPPPKLSHFKVNFSYDSQSGLGSDIAIDQVFKVGSTWGLSLNNNNQIPQQYNNSAQVKTQQQRELEDNVRLWYKTYTTDANACHNLGIALFRGEGVAKDLAASVKMFSLASKQGNINSSFNLGWVYANGTGVKQSWSHAVKYWSFAAHGGHASASRNVGLLYALGIAPDEESTMSDGNPGEPKVNYEKAVYYYEMACKLGNVKAHLALAQCYKQGTGVPVDMNKANELEEQARILQEQQAANPQPEERGLA
jgi:TPR repeat protein